jgi:predicted extracellular nuclease
LKIKLILVLPIFFLSACAGIISDHANNISSEPIRIHDIQGCAHTSPLNGKNVSAIQGLVTWKDAQGFFMQDTSPDAKTCSSEAIYVFTKQYPEVIPGDWVSVNGKVTEFNQEPLQNDQLTVTEIVSSSVKLLSRDNELPAATVIGSTGRIPPDQIIEDDGFTVFDPDTDGIDFYESLEGMRVQINDAIAVSSEDSYREVFVIPADLAAKNTLSAQGALLSGSNDLNPERIVVVLPSGFKKAINLGAQFTQPIIGILHYEYGNYEILETNTPTYKSKNVDPEPISSDLQTNSLRIATYNTENLNRFDDARIQKLATQIVKSMGSPDLLVLEEIQDDSGTQDDGTITANKTLKEIVHAISDKGGPKYFYVDVPPENDSSGGVDGGNIRTVLLYRTDRGLKMDSTEINIPVQNLSIFKNSRIPIVRLFTFQGQPFYIIGIHLISNSANSPLFGSIQPIKKPDDEKRLAQVKWIMNFAANLKLQNSKAAIIIAGDFNDTPESNPVQTLENAGFSDLANNIPSAERYSILFQGNAFLYDQIFLNSENSLFSLTKATVLHLNTYLNEKAQNSDHDPFLVELTSK